MPIITTIKPQKNGKRVNVYLDDKFGFGIDLENFVTLGLKVEQELSDEDVAEVVKKAEFQKTLDKILRFSTLRPRSEKEIRDWLKRRKVHESLHKELFNRLNRLELVDDKKFAKWWIEQRTAFRPKGKRALQVELRLKGIKREVAIEALEGVEINEDKIALEILKKKSYKWIGLPRLEGRQKMSQFLGRKGFGWETIEKVVDKVLKSALE
jgi:regulatory protein